MVILLLFIQLNHEHFFVFRLMYERWANECLILKSMSVDGKEKVQTEADLACCVLTNDDSYCCDGYCEG